MITLTFKVPLALEQEIALAGFDPAKAQALVERGVVLHSRG